MPAWETENRWAFQRVVCWFCGFVVFFPFIHDIKSGTLIVKVSLWPAPSLQAQHSQNLLPMFSPRYHCRAGWRKSIPYTRMGAQLGLSLLELPAMLPPLLLSAWRTAEFYSFCRKIASHIRALQAVSWDNPWISGFTFAACSSMMQIMPALKTPMLLFFPAHTFPHMHITYCDTYMTNQIPV